MESTDRIAEPWGARTPYPRGGVWPERVDTHLGEGVEPGQVEAWVRTASVLHSDGDAMDIAVADGRMVGVRGRVEDRVVARSQDLLARSGPGSIGFYTSGQLFLEEYYTLAVLARTGIGTNHVDGNTRLCTATADEALKQSFGCDGQPGSYSDVDHADVIALFGHNVAETQPVLWMRMLDRPGCGVLQMNGQPTAQNTRECGANGDLPGFRNGENDEHVADLAHVWNVEPSAISHYAPSTHALQICRYAEQGSVKMLWISGTNPAVSLPELGRIRSVLGRSGLFTVVQDLFLTETAQYADVVLPAATWGEKTGCFTNADRTVHLSDKAVAPRERRERTWTSSSTTPAGWTSATRTAAR